MNSTKASSYKVAFAVFISLSFINSQISASTSSYNKLLEGILKKCSDYCEKLNSSVLDFVCEEEIKEVIYPSPTEIGIDMTLPVQPETVSRSRRYEGMTKTTVSEYEYEYQLIRKKGKVREIRTLMIENGKEKKLKNAQLATTRFKYKDVILGPVGLLNTYWQQYHNYEILGEDRINKVDSYVILAHPKQSYATQHLSGKVWVSKEDFSILKIEWKQESIGNFVNVLKMAESLDATPKLLIVSEYFFEKNGIKFPSKHFIREEYLIKNQRRFKYSETTVRYNQYKFFTVETEVKY